jgi:arylformamidase
MPDPRGQPPLPFAAAVEYERTVLAWAREPLPSTVDARLGLAYGGHPAQRLDLFLPKGLGRAAGAKDAGLPLLVFWHGGGWTNGYREFVHFMAPHVTARGIALAAPSYRLAHEARLPAALYDCESALALIFREAAAWGIAPDRVALAGHSAGGHLAALTALRSRHTLSADQPLTVRADQPLTVRADLPLTVRACLPISAILDLHHPAPPEGSLEERIYTMVLADRDDDTRLSPVCWTRGNHVPFVLSCGANDSARVLRSNQRMLALLARQPAEVELVIEADADHFKTHLALADPGHPWYDRLVRSLSSSP